MTRVNVDALAALLEAARNVGTERLVHAGTSSEYGLKNHAPDEDEVLEPASDYAVTKARASELVTQGARNGLETVVLRLYSAYGPWEDPGRLVPTLLTAARQNMLPPLVDPQIARDFVFVQDVVDAFVLAARLPVARGAVYNVASGTQTTIGEVVQTVRRLFHVTAEPAWNQMAARSWDTSTWVGKVDKVRRDLNWTPRVGLEEGLRRTARWLDDPQLASRYADASGSRAT